MLLGLLRPANPGVRPAQSSIYISTCADVSELCMPSLGRRALMLECPISLPSQLFREASYEDTAGLPSVMRDLA